MILAFIQSLHTNSELIALSNDQNICQNSGLYVCSLNQIVSAFLLGPYYVTKVLHGMPVVSSHSFAIMAVRTLYSTLFHLT